MATFSRRNITERWLEQEIMGKIYRAADKQKESGKETKRKEIEMNTHKAREKIVMEVELQNRGFKDTRAEGLTRRRENGRGGGKS